MLMQLETTRLIIRSTKKEEAEFCINIWLDDEMGQYLSDPPREKAGEIYNSWKESVEIYDGCYYLIAISRETGKYIGTCSLVPNEDFTVWDIGYCVHKEHWKQGYATEIIQSLIEYCSAKGGEKMTASVAKNNIGSNKVLNNLGFSIEKEGCFKKSGTEIYFDELIYSYKLI